MMLAQIATVKNYLEKARTKSAKNLKMNQVWFLEVLQTK